MLERNFGCFVLLLVLLQGTLISMQMRQSPDYVDNNDYYGIDAGDYDWGNADSPYAYQSEAEEPVASPQRNYKYLSNMPRLHVVRQLMPQFEQPFYVGESESNEEEEDQVAIAASNHSSASKPGQLTTTTDCVEEVTVTECVEPNSTMSSTTSTTTSTTCGPDEMEVPNKHPASHQDHSAEKPIESPKKVQTEDAPAQHTHSGGGTTSDNPSQPSNSTETQTHARNSQDPPGQPSSSAPPEQQPASSQDATKQAPVLQSLPPTQPNSQQEPLPTHAISTPANQQAPTQQQQGSFSFGETSEKTKHLQEMIQHLYVAQARVQLEATEIKKAQGVANAAQTELEETTNKVRAITAALQAAQQDVASAAIRAQTAQLLLDAHDQLLFAARQDVDALSAHVVGLQVLEGISPPQANFDVNGLMDRLKQPLSESDKPTAVPPVVPMPNIPKHATTVLDFVGINDDQPKDQYEDQLGVDYDAVYT